MVVRRLFAERLPRDGGTVTLSREATAHARVLRLGEGDAVTLFDGKGLQAPAVIVGVSRERFVCDVQAPMDVLAPEASLTLVIALPKPNRLDTVVRMVTELGAQRILLAPGARSATDTGPSDTRLNRPRRISHEACAQSGQLVAPRIEVGEDLCELARAAPDDARRIVFWERADLPLDDDLGGREVWAVVGPEGGLEQAEVERLGTLGYVSASLGPSILRVDTAAVAVATLLLDRMGRLALP